MATSLQSPQLNAAGRGGQCNLPMVTRARRLSRHIGPATDPQLTDDLMNHEQMDAGARLREHPGSMPRSERRARVCAHTLVLRVLRKLTSSDPL